MTHGRKWYFLGDSFTRIAFYHSSGSGNSLRRGRIGQMEIVKTPDGSIVCTAVKDVAGQTRTIKLTIPFSTQIPIQSERYVFERLFEAWVKQRIENQSLADLGDGVLLEGEVGGLFSDIRAEDRRKNGGWTKVAGD
jgi:hypothetical protein